MYFLKLTLLELDSTHWGDMEGNFCKLEKFSYNWYKNSLVRTVFSDSCKRVLKSQLDMHKLTN